MTFKPAIWRPISIALGALNLVGVGLAAGAAEPYHAGIHATLALAFGLWAQRLQQPPAESELQGGLEALELEMGNMRRELNDAQERLDFTERVLAQRQETRQVGPER
jgi:hypothetical protein